MTKYKLAPIEASSAMINAGNKEYYHPEHPDMDAIYTTMTAQCETVEVVELEAIKEDLILLNETEPKGWFICLEFLTQNGYKIVKVCNE